MKKYILLIIILVLVYPVMGQQDFTIKGTVLDSRGVTIPSVNIYLKSNTKIGTTTDVNGNFEIKVPEKSILVFSFVGYDNYEYKVSKSVSKLKITLQESTKNIEEVVVSGAGTTQRKISVVGAISTISTKELQVPATSMSNILGGRVPGIITLQQNGEPGKNIADFWIRGISTFGANSSALVLIDGLEGDLNSVDPADVESFSVLKDASATAIYGVRGANGVVLITTKRGQAGKLNITGRVNVTLSVLKRMAKYMDAYDYAKLANEARVVRGDQPIYSNQELEIIKYGLDKDLYPDVNWQKEVIKPYTISKTYYVSARGGSDFARYFLSLGANDESAAYKIDPQSPYKAYTGYSTYSYRSNLDMDLTKSTNLYFGVDGYMTRRRQPGFGDTGGLWSAQSQLTPLVVPVRYSTGQLPAYGTNNNYSPYVMINYTGTWFSHNNNFTGTLALNQKMDAITKGLSLRIQGAYTNNTQFSERRYVLPDMFYASTRDVNGALQVVKKIYKQSAAYSYSQNQFRRYHLESALNWERVLEEKHRIGSLIYYYMDDSKSTSGLSTSLSAVPSRYQALSGRITYGYKDTYLADFNWGYTGSENFQKGRRFGFFPSIAGGWIPTNYSWTKEKLPWLTFLKIRFSLGTVGNDQISSTRFPYLTLISENASSGWGSTTPGITETRVGADNLKWERAIKTDVGIDGRLFNDKFSFTIDFFRDYRSGIFQPRAQIPDFVGLLQMPYGNVGRMVSRGADGNFTYYQKVNENISFTIRGNFTYSSNLIKNWEQATPKYDYQKLTGYPLSAQRGYIALGLFRDSLDVENSPAQNFGSAVMPGDIKYKDVNGDGVINSDDQVVLTYSNYPRLIYGFGGEFNYKRLSIGILFKGTDTGNYSPIAWSGYGYMPFNDGPIGNVLKMFNDPSFRWTPAWYSGNPKTENPKASFPRLRYGRDNNNTQFSSYWLRNNRYLRLQNVTISYHLTPRVLLPIGIHSVDLQLVGTNLKVWDKVKLFDPEQAQAAGRLYPIPAQFTLQAYITF